MRTNRQQRLSADAAFTLVEVLVSMAVLTLLLVMVTQLINGAALVTSAGNKHMDTDGQARALLDRMGLDIAAMVRRADVDYYLKGRPATNSQGGASAVNDQIAFYSEVDGYAPNGGSPGPVSLVAYRLNSGTYRMERLSKGLLWNGASTTNVPMVFLPVPLASPLSSPLPSPMPNPAPNPIWPQAASATAVDVDYEAFGPLVFRFEYYYVLKAQDASGTNPAILSDTPWDVRPPANGTAVAGLKDVSAIGVAVAIIDQRSRALLSDVQVQTLAGQMSDFNNTMKPGQLEAGWQAAVSAAAIPKVSIQGIHIYGRTFSLNSRPQ